MKDIIEKILAYLPQYFAELGQLCSAPKRFIAERDVNSDETFAASLLFLAISLVLATLISALLSPTNKEIWTQLAPAAVSTMIDVTLGTLAIYIAWWIVGARPKAKGFFTSFVYFTGALYVVGAAVSLFTASIVKVLEPERFEKLMEHRSGSEQLKMMFDPTVATRIIGEPSTTLYVVMGITWTRYLLFFVWIIFAWGAFRKLSGLSRIRSFFAFLIAVALSFIGIYAQMFVDLAMQ